MDGADQTAQEALNFVTTVLKIPAEWLTWPYAITYILIPLIFNTAGFYFFLNSKLRIFKSSMANIILGFIIAFVALPFGWWGMVIGVGMVALFGVTKWYNRAAFVLLVYFIISLFYIGIETQMLFIVLGLLTVLLSFKISTGSPITTWIIRIIVIAAVLALLSYVSQGVEQFFEGVSSTYGL